MAMGLTPTRDPRLNELEYFTLGGLLSAQHGIPFPKEQPEFIAHLPAVFQHWKDGKLGPVDIHLDAIKVAAGFQLVV
jgi:hypothetical protein